MKPHLKAGMNEAAWMYDKGKGASGWYPGATYIGPNKMEMDAMGGIEGLARGQNPFLPGMQGQFDAMMRGGGVTDEQRSAMSPMWGISSGANKITETGIGEGNPYLMNVLDQAASKAGQAIGSQMGAGGRIGGGAHQGIMAREIGDLYQRGLSDQMNKDLDRRMQVQGANIANQAGASQSLSDMFGQGSGMAAQYAAMAPMMDEMRYSGANKLLQTGAAQRGEAQAQLQDNVNRWQAKQDQGKNNLAWYMSMIGGTPTFSNTQTSVPKGSPLMGALGGGLGGAQLGSMFGPWGMGIGAGLGGLFGGWG